MRISDWSSDVCSSDLREGGQAAVARRIAHLRRALEQAGMQVEHVARIGLAPRRAAQQQRHLAIGDGLLGQIVIDDDGMGTVVARSEEHTSELQSLMRISYAVFCLKKKKNNREREQKDNVT